MCYRAVYFLYLCSRKTRAKLLTLGHSNKLSFAIDGHRLLSRLDIVQVNLTLCSLFHQFA